MAWIRARLTAAWRAPLSPEGYRVVTGVALAALAAIVVSGAAVRLTGSGMGCPTWPSCEDGSLVPRGATGGHGWVEFLNRTFTGAVSIAVALAVLGSRRLRSPRPDLTRLAWALVAGVFAQALLGGLVVWLHVAPLAVAGHYLLSAVLVAAAVVLHHRAGLPLDRPAPVALPALRRWTWALAGLAVVVLVTGTVVTGSGPHGGDEAADRLPFAVRTVVPIHSVAVWVLLAASLVVLHRVERGDGGPGTARPARALLVAIAAQGGIGYLQYFTGVPEGLVGLHVLGSVVVWAATLRLHLAVHEPAPGALAPAGPTAPSVAPTGQQLEGAR